MTAQSGAWQNARREDAPHGMLQEDTFESHGSPMSIKQWFFGLLSRGEAAEPDPNEVVEVETTALTGAPIMIAALQDEGIDASSVEAFDPVTAITRARIMVRRSDLPAALEVLGRLR